jgi:hypothetical protein
MLPGLGALSDYWKSIARGRHFHLRAVAGEPRTEAIAQAESAVQRRHGDILDCKLFSNLVLNLIIEMEASAVVEMAAALERRGWSVDLEPAREAIAARGHERLEGTFAIRFPEGDGGLAIPQPVVPG